jgi:hypothetical protein
MVRVHAFLTALFLQTREELALLIEQHPEELPLVSEIAGLFRFKMREGATFSSNNAFRSKFYVSVSKRASEVRIMIHSNLILIAMEYS